MENDAVKEFLEQTIFSMPIEKIKRFGKGQLSAFYVKLSDGTELTIKFYNKEEKVQYAYNIAHMLRQNKDLRVPRLYKLKEKYFQYKEFYGLCFYYIKGEEISAAKLNKNYFEEIASAYAVSQKPIKITSTLFRDKTLPEYIENIKTHYLTLKSTSSKKIQQIIFKISLYLAKKLVKKIEKQHNKEENIPQKIIHCDITKSNMLFDNGHFEAFIDTDSVCYSYIGRDFAEFIISSVLHYPFFKNKKKSIKEWYEAIDQRYNLSQEEYIYGLDIYYLYRLQCRIKQYQSKTSWSKLLNFMAFIRLRKITLNLIKKIKHQ